MTAQLRQISHVVLILGCVVAAPLVAQGDAEGILQRASSRQMSGAENLSVTFQGTLIDPTDGSERLFLLLVQGGEQLLYFLWATDGTELGRWSYDRGRSWYYSPSRDEVVEQTGDSNQSWHLLALILSPNHFSLLQQQALGYERIAAGDGRDPLLRFTFENNLDFIVTLRETDLQMMKMERLSNGVTRTLAFVNPRIVEGELRMDGMSTLRDGVPHRHYRFESITYDQRLGDTTFSSSSFFELPFFPPNLPSEPQREPEEAGVR